MNKKPSMAGAGRPKAKKGTLKRVLKFLFKMVIKNSNIRKSHVFFMKNMIIYINCF